MLKIGFMVSGVLACLKLAGILEITWFSTFIPFITGLSIMLVLCFIVAVSAYFVNRG